jgi:hypothetical protein
MRNNTLNLKGEELERAERMGIVQDSPKPGRKGWRRRLFSSSIIVVGLIILFYIWTMLTSGFAWRAVFLANNQVYFGHFWDVPFAGTITLHDVYYLQVAQPGQQLSGQDQSQLKLVKLGNEVHGPTSEMVIPISQVLFWETLRSDSAIVKTIQNGQPQ